MEMKFKKLTKVKEDVIFIDPLTMKKICSLNECINKFDTVTEQAFKRMKRGVEFDLVQQFHVCNECGRRYASHTDKHKNYGNFVSACRDNLIPLLQARKLHD
jgi:hypothetical protein